LTTITDKQVLRQASVAERRLALPPEKGSAIMADEFARLVQANEHVAGAKERIHKQRKLIERLTAEGHHVSNAESLLSALSGSLAAFENHRRLILDRLR